MNNKGVQCTEHRSPLMMVMCLASLIELNQKAFSGPRRSSPTVFLINVIEDRGGRQILFLTDLTGKRSCSFVGNSL